MSALDGFCVLLVIAAFGLGFLTGYALGHVTNGDDL